MSCEGPIVSFHPSTVPSPVHLHAHDVGIVPPMSTSTPPPHYYNKHLRINTRERASSTPSAESAQLHVPLSHSQPSGSGSVFRSHSLPRAANIDDDDQEMSLPVGIGRPRSPATTGARSSRFIRRAETIDTDTIRKEEFEEYTRVNQYKVLDIIGHGSYGIVRKATDDHDDVYAMKIVGKGRLRRKSFPVRPPPGSRGAKMKGGMHMKSPLNDMQREIAILKKLDHPNVVRLYEVLDDPREDELVLVFEYIPKGAVLPQLPLEKPLSEDQAREYFIDVILGMEYLHSQHVIHRDIKPENLLLDENNTVKIADFGVSEELVTSESHLSRSAGTPAFLAPECLDASKKTYKGQAVDIWAAGITLYCFIFGRVPWSSKYITELHEKIRHEALPLPESVSISPELRDLLIKLLEKKAERRITIPETREHPWVLKTSRILPTHEENCRAEIVVSEQEIKNAFKPFSTPIHILVMIKQMAKRRSLSRPFSGGSPSSSPRSSPKHSPRQSSMSSMSPRSPRSMSPESPLSQSTHSFSSSSINSGRRRTLMKSHNAPTICVDSVDDVQ